MEQTGETRARSRRSRRRVRQVLAWLVHGYTALGLVAAAGMAVLIYQGGPEAFRTVFLLMMIATLIDATDGTLARRVRVKEVLPQFDGALLDNIIDFLTYTFLPLLLLWRANVLPPGHEWWLLVPLLASVYGFCQVSAKTSDGYFLGFPSYWNLVAFYLYVLQLPAWLTIAILVGFSVLTFVPSRYICPTRRGRLNWLTNILAAPWTCLLVYILYRLPAGPVSMDPLVHDLAVVSLGFPTYYLLASWTVSLRLWRRRRFHPVPV